MAASPECHAYRLPLLQSSPLAILLLLLLPLQGRAAYDEAWCKSLTDTAMAGNETIATPYFLDDYSVKAEEIILDVENNITEKLLQVKILFAKDLDQMAYTATSRDNDFYARVDAALDDIIFLNNSFTHVCEDGDFSKWNKFSTFGKVSKYTGNVELVSAKSSFGWRTDTLKASVELGPGQARGIASDRYATCHYDENADTTTVSEWYFLDVHKMESVHGDNAILLQAKHESKDKNGRVVDARWIDYFDLKKLTPTQMTEGLKLPEYECLVTESVSLSKEFPTPHSHFRLTNQITVMRPTMYSNSFAIIFEYQEYDYDARLFTVEMPMPMDDENEAAVQYRVEDFNTGYVYVIDKLGGGCQSHISLKTKMGVIQSDGSVKMKTPHEYWGISKGGMSYVGPYTNRGIPCDSWRINSNSGRSVDTIYMASQDWLNMYDMPEDSFFPVEVITYTESLYTFKSIYEYKPNPGYNIPDVSACFHPEDNVVLQLTLPVNYYKTIHSSESQLRKQFRKMVLKVSGIVSPIRVAQISAAPFPSDDEKTLVAFKILGRVKPDDDAPPSYHESDPLPSKDAAKQIEAAVDAGRFKLRLPVDMGDIVTSAQSGSLIYLDKDFALDFMREMKRLPPKAAASSGYSGVVVVITCLVALLVSLALSVGAVLAFRRWYMVDTRSGPTITMQSLSET